MEEYEAIYDDYFKDKLFTYHYNIFLLKERNPTPEKFKKYLNLVTMCDYYCS